MVFCGVHDALEWVLLCVSSRPCEITLNCVFLSSLATVRFLRRTLTLDLIYAIVVLLWTPPAFGDGNLL